LPALLWAIPAADEDRRSKLKTFSIVLQDKINEGTIRNILGQRVAITWNDDN